ncbi:MAG TPA: tetratricopeptide repeat protein [Nostocaceae cyanobacterium]|nr:tetratricopeptide repeat protein [Nostocaceae cyanobacterium]
MARPSYGDDVKARVKRLFAALLAFANDEVEGGDKLKIELNKENETQLIFRTQLRMLEGLTAIDKNEEKLTKTQVREALNRLKDFLFILEDNRTSTQGSENWHFTLKLWFSYKNHKANLERFDREWDNNRPEKSKKVAEKKDEKNIEVLNIPENLPNAVEFDRFIGRETELENLHQELQISQQVAIVAVRGMGGVGKTELATQYAKQYLQNYPGGVCWLSAPGLEVGISILRFAEDKFNIIAPDDRELVDRVKFCWQRWPNGEVLLIIDDVTDYKKQVLPYLPPQVSRFKVLVTTRFQFDRTLRQIRLDVLKPRAAMQLLILYVGRERIKQEAWTARKICRFLGYLPLGLELVGRYLDLMPDLSLEKLLQRLEKKKLEHEAIAKANPLMRYEYGVAEAIALSWEQLDENAKGLACRLSLYALADIPFDWEGIEDDEEQEILETAINDLVHRHLLQRKIKGIYRLHPLVRQFLQMQLNKSENADEVKTAFIAQMMEIGEQIPQQPTIDLIKQVFIYIPHIAEVVNHLKDYISDDNFIRPFTRLGWFYQGQGLYQQAEPYYQQCLELAKHRLGKEHPQVATSLNNLAALYYSTGRYTEAEPLYQDALAMRKRLLGDEHPDVAASLNNLAGLYESTGRYTEAEPLYQDALAMTKRLLGDEHPDVATSLNNLAELYRVTGRYTEAEPLYAQALAMTKRLLGDEHPDVATSLNNLALLYYSTGRYTEAEPLYAQALAMRKRLLGDEHPDVAASLNNLAALYKSIGRYTDAEPLYTESLAMTKRLLGDEHPQVAASLNNLAGLYESTGRYTEAEPLYLQALELRKRLLGDEHPDVATSLNNLAALYESTGRYTEAEPLYLEAVEIFQRCLGANHPNTVTARKNLAGLWMEGMENNVFSLEELRNNPLFLEIIMELRAKYGTPES